MTRTKKKFSNTAGTWAEPETKDPLKTFIGGLLIGLFTGAIITETILASLVVFHY